MARPKRKAEKASGPPTWIVSFSDMVTLLLAFFVLLQSFAHVQDPELFFVGQGSFRQAIAGMGIPKWLFGREDKPRLGHVKIKHPTEEGPPVQPKPRVIDAENEKIRKVFADLKEEMDTTASDVSQRPIDVVATPIRFDAGAAVLDDAAKAYLQQFALDLRQTVQAEAVRFYVIALAADESDPKRQWSVSARRARVAEAYLAARLEAAGAPRDWSVYSWGGGPGGDWCRKHGLIPKRTAIVIAVMKESN